jgi:hypothetical protein
LERNGKLITLFLGISSGLEDVFLSKGESELNLNLAMLLIFVEMSILSDYLLMIACDNDNKTIL